MTLAHTHSTTTRAQSVMCIRLERLRVAGSCKFPKVASALSRIAKNAEKEQQYEVQEKAWRALVVVCSRSRRAQCCLQALAGPLRGWFRSVPGYHTVQDFVLKIGVTSTLSHELTRNTLKRELFRPGVKTFARSHHDDNTQVFQLRPMRRCSSRRSYN